MSTISLAPHQHPSQIDSQSIDHWIFDLDNTIYPAKTSLFPRVAEKMGLFIAETFDLPIDEAMALKTRLFREYGTTMHGLMHEFKMEPTPFLDYVHEIDLSDIDIDPDYDAMLSALPGDKHIFTNGTVRHAERILEAYGIRHHFDVIFDIVAADYVPKPDRKPYDLFLGVSGINPQRAIMVEDMARNLEVPSALGMKTVWLTSNEAWAIEGSDQPYIDFIAEDNKSLLAGITASA